MSSSVGPEYYVSIMSFVDKSQARCAGAQRNPRHDRARLCAAADAPASRAQQPLATQLEPGCSVLMHNKGLAIVGILSDEVDPLVSVMKARALAPRALATRTP